MFERLGVIFLVIGPKNNGCTRQLEVEEIIGKGENKIKEESKEEKHRVSSSKDR